MNKKLYNILGYIPVIGRIVQIKTNFFAFKPSPFMAEFTKTNDYKVLTDWLKNHPDQVRGGDDKKWRYHWVPD